MPRREDIERFAQVLTSLGDEPAIRAARSETAPEVPGETAPAAEADLLEGAGTPGADLLEPSADLPEPGADLPEPGADTADADLQDLFQGLSTLPESTEEPGAAPGGPTEAPGEPDGIDFGSLLGDETSQQPIEDV